MRRRKVTPHGPAEFLLEVIERIDSWDTLCFERSKIQAFTHRQLQRMAKAEKLYKQTRRRVRAIIAAAATTTTTTTYLSWYSVVTHHFCLDAVAFYYRL